MNELALFAGAGGGILGGKLLGWRTVCAVERDAYAAQVLAQRQNDGILPPFPIWSDVCSFDGKPWQGIVDVVSGGFPCQDISVAGKGAGITGERSGLWSEMARIIGEVRPRFAFIENSPALVNRGHDRVLADLAALGFDAEWGVLSAADVGAQHIRERIWILAYSKLRGLSERWGVAFAIEEADRQTGIPGDVAQGVQQQTREVLAYANGSRKLQQERFEQNIGRWIGNSSWWESEPSVGRVAYGVAHGVDRDRAIGNGQVPLCAATAFRLLAARAGVE